MNSSGAATEEEVYRHSLERFLTKRYGTDWKIEKFWRSDHGAVCDCGWEYTCHYLSRDGYWNAWTVRPSTGKRGRWFFSWRTHKWYGGRVKPHAQ